MFLFKMFNNTSLFFLFFFFYRFLHLYIFITRIVIIILTGLPELGGGGGTQKNICRTTIPRYWKRHTTSVLGAHRVDHYLKLFYRIIIVETVNFSIFFYTKSVKFTICCILDIDFYFIETSRNFYKCHRTKIPQNHNTLI